MKYLLFASIVLLLILSSSTCDTSIIDNTCRRDYSFTMPISITPVQDTFQIGDTLKLSFNFPVQMEDALSGSFFDMSDVPFNTKILIAKLDENPAQSAEHFFEYIPIIGNVNLSPLSGGIISVNIIFKTSLDTRLFECLVIVKEPGFYGMGFFDRNLVYWGGQIEDNCFVDSIAISYLLNQNLGHLNHNFQFLQFSPDPRVRNITKEEFIKDGGYAFFVE